MERLIERVKSILLIPEAEWLVVAQEPDDTAALFTRYVAVLALIPALAGFIGVSVIGGRGSLTAGFAGAVVGYLLSFAAVFLVALIADAAAPTFGVQKNFPSALKLTVYSYTPAWLAGVFLLIPALSLLTFVGLYGGYLLWLGLPPLMHAPRGKTLPYAAAIVVCALIIEMLTGTVQFTMFGRTR
jgi:hypothetical protein